MLCLPKLVAESSSGGRPLAEPTARGLAEAFLSEPSARPAPLERLLSADADLAQWVVRRAEQDGFPAPDSVPAQAAWLAEHGLRVLQWEETCQDSFLPTLMRRLRRLQQLETDFAAALETEKLEALRAFAYGASHEINNPLANISTRAQTLLREETDPERRRKLAVINSQAFRAHELIADLMLFARPPEPQIAPVNFTAMADQIIAELAVDAEEQGTVLVRTSPAEPVWGQADASQLSVALTALCRNALEALISGGRVEVAVRPAPLAAPAAPEGVEIQVRDTGPGITPEARRRLFDPYFSGREAGRGIGLGLSKCWRIVTQHGGRIDVASEPGRGATFTLRLPNRLPETGTSAFPGRP